MMPDLTDDGKAILVELLRETTERDRFPFSPQVRSFKAILAKLDPPAALGGAFPITGADFSRQRERSATQGETRFCFLVAASTRAGWPERSGPPR